MNLKYLDAGEIERLLPIADCIDVMESAFSAFGRGDIVQPLRTVVHRPDGAGSLYVMPSFNSHPAALAVKLISVFHGNRARGVPSHQGIVVAFDAASGTPAAILDAASLTAIRTAAVSALATRLLARSDADDLTLLGSGTQAWSHLEAMRVVRPIRRVRVWSPNVERRRTFAEKAAAMHDIPVVATDSPKAAVERAHIVCTLTSSATPVLHGDWLARGTHINAVGASTPNARELDTNAVLRSRVVVDSLRAALSESGDLLIPIREGAMDEGSIAAELADLVLGSAPARRGADQITLFKSLGLAMEDAAAAAAVIERAALA